jgi:uncharacterized protein (TIGR02453 family)
MASPFTAKTLSFLRALKRNNDREWFRAHRADYEAHVRGPMIGLIDRLARDLRGFAPDLVSDPKVSLYRIYRDTRFSADKTPLKTHVAAHFPSRVFGRGGGAGLYVEVTPKWVWIGGGLYMPDTGELQAIREHISTTHPRLHRLVTSTLFKRRVGALEGDRLTRVPRGYRPDHPAAHYLQFRQFLAGREYDANFAVSPRFYPELVAVFRGVAPVVRFLNVPLQERLTQMPLSKDEEIPRRLQPARELSPPPAPMW